MRHWALSVEDLPDPVPQSGQALTWVLACGICGSDLHVLQHGAEQLGLRDELAAENLPDPLAPQPFVADEPVVMGHEFCCEVVELGPGRENLAVGDVVVSMPGAIDAAGVHAIGYSNRYPGGYGELLVVNDLLALKVPDGLPARAAASPNRWPSASTPWPRAGSAARMPQLCSAATWSGWPSSPTWPGAVWGRSSRRTTPARRRLAEHLGAHEVVDSGRST